MPSLISSAIAAGVPVTAPTDFSVSLMNMLPIVAMFAVFYFVIIRPQMKKQKETKSMVDSLSKGDKVVTAGGLIGKIVALENSEITLQIAPNVEVQIQRVAVVQALPNK